MLEHRAKQGLGLWTKVEQALAKSINQNTPSEFKLDWSCTDITRVLLLVGPQNSKSRTQAKIVYQNDATYRLDALTKDYFSKLYISSRRRRELEENKKLVHKTAKQKQEFKIKTDGTDNTKVAPIESMPTIVGNSRIESSVEDGNIIYTIIQLKEIGSNKGSPDSHYQLSLKDDTITRID